MRDPSSYLLRDGLSLLALLGMAVLSLALLAYVFSPFVPGLVWALSFAIVADPLHEWIARRLKYRDLAAAAGVLVVALALVAPSVWVGRHIAEELTTGLEYLQRQLEAGTWDDALAASPRIHAVYAWITSRLDVSQAVQLLAKAAERVAGTWVMTLGWGLVQLALALFALFYLFRDRELVLRTIRSFMPLSRRESDYLFEQVRATTHATIYGTVVVSLIQGALGGLMFAVLGIPGAFLWGVAMALVAIVPTLGPFVIWAPAALFLALQGDWGKALVLTAWGTVVVGLIDNLLYPILVGKEMRLHTLPVFLAIVGGLVVFGAVGVVLGPVILAAAMALLEILRRRTRRPPRSARPIDVPSRMPSAGAPLPPAAGRVSSTG